MTYVGEGNKNSSGVGEGSMQCKKGKLTPKIHDEYLFSVIDTRVSCAGHNTTPLARLDFEAHLGVIDGSKNNHGRQNG